MSRLPTPGSDDGNWGEILNDFLEQSHNSDGSLKSSAIPTIAASDVITSDSSTVQAKITDHASQLAVVVNDVTRSSTIVVAAADSAGTYGYDYKCTGTNDETTIAMAVAALPASGGKIVMLEGHYSKGNAQPIALPSNVEIEILAGATFTIASGINADACFFSNADKINGNTNIRIHGAGKFDCNFRNQTGETYQYLADFDKVANGLIDVYITNFTMLEAKLKRSRVDLINRKFMQPEVLLAECESISEFVYTSGTVVTNTGGGVSGGNCIKMTPTSTTPAVVGKVLPDSDLEDEEYLAYEAEVYIKADDPSKIKELTIGAGLGSSADELAVVIDATTKVTKLFEAGKWHRIRVPMNRYIVSGVPQFRVIVRGNETTDVYLGRIRLLPAPLRPALTWIWDDAMGGTSEHKALPGVQILAKYGHVGAIAQMGATYVGGTQYMTQEELDRVCFEYGWDICVHSYTHLEDDVPFNDAVSLLVANKTFIEQSGWKGSNYLVFAGHDTRGEITSEMNKVFNDYRNPLQYPPIARQGRITIAKQIVTLSDAMPRIRQSLRRHLWLSHYSHGVGGTQVSASELELWAQFFYDWGLISKTPSEIIGDYNPRYNILTT